MPITRTPCRRVTAYRAAEYVNDYDCREDIGDFIERATESYSVTAYRALCALGDFDEYRQTEPVLYFIATNDRSAAHLSMDGLVAVSPDPPSVTGELTAVWSPDNPRQLKASEFGVTLETLQAAVFEFVDTGYRPSNVAWRATP